MKDLETLLNQLLKMGWKPFNETVLSIEYQEDELRFNTSDKWYSQYYFEHSLRKLVSLESGLWEFCGDNNLLNILDRKWNDSTFLEFDDSGYEYRLIESALVPEEELAQFLVNNIVIKGQ